MASYTTILTTQGKYQTAAKVIAKYGGGSSGSNVELYQRVAKLVLKDPDSGAEDYSNLRTMLYQLVYPNGPSSPNQKMLDAFGPLLQIAHTLHLRSYCASKKDLLSFSAKQAISALRYTATIPSDRAFLEAGQAAKVLFLTEMNF